MAHRDRFVDRDWSFQKHEIGVTKSCGGHLDQDLIFSDVRNRYIIYCATIRLLKCIAVILFNRNNLQDGIVQPSLCRWSSCRWILDTQNSYRTISHGLLETIDGRSNRKFLFLWLGLPGELWVRRSRLDLYTFQVIYLLLHLSDIHSYSKSANHAFWEKAQMLHFVRGAVRLPRVPEP